MSDQALLVAVLEWLQSALEARDPEGDSAEWGTKAMAKIADESSSKDRFYLLFSQASRFSPRGPLEPSAQATARAEGLLPGWTPERWTALEAQRVRLVLARAQADDATLPEAMEEAFRFADEGELCALYRSLQFLPGPERFLWRSKEGCRTNMKTVFEANGLDTAYPAAHFDDVAWRQLCIKSLFVESPLWRLHGFDDRVDDELARMALDLSEERRAAGRRVYPELWMCLGSTPAERSLAAVEAELSGEDELSRKAAILALGRMSQTVRLKEIEEDGGSLFGPVANWALIGRHDRTAFQSLSPPEGATPSTFNEY